MGDLIGRVRASADALKSTRPILSRELLGLLRSRKAFRVTLFTVGLVSLIPLLNWPRGDEVLAYHLAGQVYAVYKWSFIAALLLFVPAVSAGGFSEEREAGTYDLLHASRLRPAGIVLGKLLSRTAFFLLIFAFTFPLVLILYLLGGFEFREFFLTALEIVILTIFLGVVGLWSSVRQAKTSRAIGEAFLLSLALLFLIAVLGNVIGEILAVVLSSFLHRDTISSLGFCVAQLGIGALLFVSLLGWARIPDISVIRAKVEGRPVGKKTSTRPSEAKGWLARRVLKRTLGGIPDGWNPIFVASLRDDDSSMARSYRMFFAIVVGLTTLIVFVAVLNASAESFGKFSWGFGVAMVLIIALIVPSLSAWSLAHELQPERLDPLRSTPLRPRDLLLGKLSATYVHSFGLLVTMLVLRAMEWIALMVAFPAATLRSLFATLALVACFVCVAALASTAGFLAASLLGRRFQSIVLANLGSWGFLVGAPVLLDFIGSEAAVYVSPVHFLVDEYWRDSTDFFARAGVSLVIAGLVATGQLFLATAIFRKRWLRER